jgi:Fur family ferric uptake transcriptional regulator
MSCNTTLKEKGHRLTPQRGLILDIIHKSHAHLSAEDIFTQVQSRVSGVDKSTVYRTLDLLEELGCVVKSQLGERFIYHHMEEGHHHHLICRTCGKGINCDEDLLLLVKKALIEQYGFQADFKHMVIKGLCAVCRGSR